jgi:hypothetical protein
VICKARAGKDGSVGAIYLELTEIKEDFSSDGTALIVNVMQYREQVSLTLRYKKQKLITLMNKI